jgi:hypothetical protein
VLVLLITVFRATKCLSVVTYVPKAGITVPKETVVAKEQLCKHISTATDSRDRSKRHTRNNRRTVRCGIFYVIRAEVIK